MEALIRKIQQLKKEKNAVILAHYYVNDEVQAVADYTGDSYYLSQLAVDLPQSTLIVCGVQFMGESAKILNPTKKVLIPDASADCPMAHMITPEKLLLLKESHPNAAVVCYINSTAEVKAYCDVCVTSSNALAIVNNLPNKEIIFIPDANLGRYVAAQLPDKKFIFSTGYCPTHAKILPETLLQLKERYPHAPVLTHPECIPEVTALSDYVGSTKGILNYAKSHDDSQFIICTEVSIHYALKQGSPEKEFIFVSPTPTCHNMKKITLEAVADTLEHEKYEVLLEEDKRLAAALPLQKMLTLAKKGR